MKNGYSLRKAAELAGIPTMTFHGYKNRGVIEPDVEDKKGDFTLFSDEQVRRAKDYYGQSSRSRKKSVKEEDEVSVSQEKLDQAESVAETILPVAVEIITLEVRADNRHCDRWHYYWSNRKLRKRNLWRTGRDLL